MLYPEARGDWVFGLLPDNLPAALQLAAFLLFAALAVLSFYCRIRMGMAEGGAPGEDAGREEAAKRWLRRAVRFAVAAAFCLFAAVVLGALAG